MSRCPPSTFLVAAIGEEKELRWQITNYATIAENYRDKNTARCAFTALPEADATNATSESHPSPDDLPENRKLEVEKDQVILKFIPKYPGTYSLQVSLWGSMGEVLANDVSGQTLRVVATVEDDSFPEEPEPLPICSAEDGIVEPDIPLVREAGFERNETTALSSGEYAGCTCIWDPFDLTETIIRSNGTGVLRIWSLGRGVHIPETVELSALRVRILAYLDSKQGTAQEGPDGPQSRLQGDINSYNRRHTKWEQEGRKDPEPTQRRTTLCVNFPPAMGLAITNNRDSGNIGFDPSVTGNQRGSWRTLETHPEGPKPGDVYSLGAADNPASIKHIGIFRSKRNGTCHQIWTVVDGGQTPYNAVQEIRERTRLFDMATHLLSSKLADGGQGVEPRALRGWIDVDSHFAGI
ncbi:MAG: hypothetical protein JW863_10540 [Chitinispirillaceae bacterium]|nr:hypothetical protein [Chitinispirillaceae bacterium]